MDSQRRGAPGCPAQVTLVHAPACHFCADAEQVLVELGQRYRLEVERLDVLSPRGSALMQQHRAAMTPLVLLDGAFFSAGRLPRRKLAHLLERRASVRMG